MRDWDIYPGGRKQRSSSGYLIFKYIIILFSIIGMMIFYIWERIVANQLVRDIQILSQKEERLKDENNRLGIQITKLMAIDRIEKVAKDSLGMTVPSQKPVILYYYVKNTTINEDDHYLISGDLELMIGERNNPIAKTLNISEPKRSPVEVIVSK